MTDTPEAAEWQWLQPHAKRDAIILVAEGLDLLEVGKRMIADDTQAVQAWIEAGQVLKPTAEQLESWDTEPHRKFMALIVAPYVLVQTLSN